MKITSTKMCEIEKRYIEGKKPMNGKAKNILKSSDNFSAIFFSHEANDGSFFEITDRTDRFFSKNGYVFFIDNSINIYTSIHSIHSIHPYILYSVFTNKTFKFLYSIKFLADMSDRRLECNLLPVYQYLMSSHFISDLSESDKTIESSIKPSHGYFCSNLRGE